MSRESYGEVSLLVRAYDRVRNVDPGFNPSGVGLVGAARRRAFGLFKTMRRGWRRV